MSNLRLGNIEFSASNAYYRHLTRESKCCMEQTPHTCFHECQCETLTEVWLNYQRLSKQEPCTINLIGRNMFPYSVFIPTQEKKSTFLGGQVKLSCCVSGEKLLEMTG